MDTVMPFVIHSALMHKRHKLRAFYLYICVAPGIHRQHTTYVRTKTLTPVMLTLISLRGLCEKRIETEWMLLGGAEHDPDV